MFEVGKDYRITTGEGGERAYSVYTLLEVALPLIMVEDGGGAKIINTHAPNFIEAEPLESDPEAQPKSADMAEEFTDGDAEDDQEQVHSNGDTSSTPPTGA